MVFRFSDTTFSNWKKEHHKVKRGLKLDSYKTIAVVSLSGLINMPIICSKKCAIEQCSAEVSKILFFLLLLFLSL